MAEDPGASQHQDESTNLFVSTGAHVLAMPSVLDSESDFWKRNSDIRIPCNCCNETSCTLAKRSKQNHADIPEISYLWKQTDSDADVTIQLSEDPSSDLHVDITNTAISIHLSADHTEVIHLYKAIDSGKSWVELKKEASGALILIHIMKQCRESWVQLETSDTNIKQDDCSSLKSWHFINDQFCCDSDTSIMASKNELAARQQIGDAALHQTLGLDLDLMRKEEESVYSLPLMKNDFFEKGLVLTLHVYVKNVEKDAVVIHFTRQGFILKFRTDDAKFLNLYKGTTKDTTFIWPVTTRKEIVPDECKYKVKSTLIEISLQKTSHERWTSLEAPTKKETTDSSNSNSWICIKKSNQPAAQVSKSSAQPDLSFSNTSLSSVPFDDLSEVGVRDRELDNFRATPNSISCHQMEEGEGGANHKLRASASQDWNKPTAKVHPLNSHSSETGNVISSGYAGLANLGNTCFMNCILQVLANTKEFKDYFLDGRYKQEINHDNPLGMRGYLAMTFGIVMRWLWSCKKTSWEPRKLKDLISQKNPQFFGYAQHDAHEFLAFLLDGLHEDLNRIRKKPYTETIDSDGRPDEVVAALSWAQYKQRNDSVVVDLFQGQYKSKLVCLGCGKVSITFDPFLYLSVPIPKKKKTIVVTFMWKESYKKPVRYHIRVSQDSTVDKLLQELSLKTKVRPSNIRVFEAYRGRLRKFFSTGASLDSVEFKDTIVACEVLSEELAGEEVLELIVMQRTMHPTEYPSRCAFCSKPCSDGIQLKRCTKCFKVGYCDQACQKKHWTSHKSHCSSPLTPIGCPFILSLPRSRATYGYLVKHMEEFSRFSVDVFQPPVKSSEGGSTHTASCTSISASNLDHSLSQSCSSLDSLSSASSTCTLTGNQSDSNNQDMGEDLCDGNNANQTDMETNVWKSGSSSQCSTMPSSPQTACGSDSQIFGESSGACWLGSSDSGFQSLDLKEKVPPISQVMGVQMTETDREKATPTFFIKPVTADGVGNGERLEDKGDQALDLTKIRFLSMDWRNNEKQSFYVLVQSKELEADETNDLNNMAACFNNKPTLYQCLELFTEPEVLSPEEAWYCPSCKKHVEAIKQMTIWRLPHILIIQLKRFSFQNFLMRAKVNEHVDFPTRGLDMSCYCAGSIADDDSRPIYDLYGVVNHQGLLIGGHYTSYVRCCSDNSSLTDEVGWRLCDDSQVSPVTAEKSVVNADAYLLFYCRRGHKAVIGPASDADRAPTQACQGASASSTDSNMMYTSLDDGSQKQGNNQESQDSQVTVDRDMSRGETLNHANMNVKSIPRDQTILYKDEKPHICQCGDDSTASTDGQEFEVEMSEKGDDEKDFQECSREVTCGDDDNNDSNYEDNDSQDANLIIDMQTDLGYTDMEAVD